MSRHKKRTRRQKRRHAPSQPTPYRSAEYAPQAIAHFAKDSSWKKRDKKLTPAINKIYFASDFGIQDLHLDHIINLGTSFCHALQHFTAGCSDTGNGHLLTDAAVIRLAHACPNLIHLSLDSATQLTDESLLAFLTNCPNLQYVQIAGNNKQDGSIKGPALHHLITTPSSAPNLRQLVITDQPSQKETKRLSQTRKNLKIEVGNTDERFASEFVPPVSTPTPDDLFHRRRPFRQFTVGGLTYREEYAHPLIHKDDAAKALVFVDGSCLDNGRHTSRAGWACVMDDAKTEGIRSGQLELSSCPPTSNRAELRAAIAALSAWEWKLMGYTSLVIAADSEYVVKGATDWAQSWVRNGWRTSSRGAVENRDLWETLVCEIDLRQRNGLTIEFWRIPRGWNEAADRAAKDASDGMVVGA
ncbi:hypothetical protein CDD80_121 [Ophiocordyceps camponoti-rufipedis]|uniref:ribonuclease H n=1 Tax=Ophiocordyceps camponoti-rufipedis TaxID=2004952 RepID=A0A2C5ZFA0_9HYPO|nr:hypothetical protein CDD80_121 [Ophiocordyceps camponoti-rufipedis]